MNKRTLEKLRRQGEATTKLADMRFNLSVIQRMGDERMYGMALIEYASLLGEWEKVNRA